MPLFDTIENFPMTYENVDGVIVPITRQETYAIAYATKLLENIFNDNRRIGL